jgi:hypothetical protein
MGYRCRGTNRADGANWSARTHRPYGNRKSRTNWTNRPYGNRKSRTNGADRTDGTDRAKRNAINFSKYGWLLLLGEYW